MDTSKSLDTAGDSPPAQARGAMVAARQEKAMGHVRAFLMGMTAPFHGLRFLLAHKSLIPYAVIPFLINVTVTFFLLAVLLTSAVGIMYWIHGMPYFATSAWHRVGEVVLDLVILAALLGITAGTYILLGGILSIFFNERLAKQVEIVLGTPADQLQEAPLKQQAIDGVRGFLTVVLTTIGCAMLGCIPLLNIAGACISFYVDWFVFGYEYFEMPMSLRGFRRKSRRAFARQHRAKVLGLGATVFFLGLIPIIGSVFLTTAAVGSVLLYRKLPPPGMEEDSGTIAATGTP